MTSAEHEVEAKIILELPQVEMHRLINNQRTPFTAGLMRVCELEKSAGEKVYFINLNSFYYTVARDTTFVKVVYKKSVSYVYVHFDAGLVSITIPIGGPGIQNFEEILRNIASLVTLQQAKENPFLAAKLQEHALNIDKVQIANPDKVQQIINTTGQYAETGFKWLGNVIGSGVNKIGTYLDQKIENKNEIKLSDNTKQKWNEIKQGTGRIMTVSGDFLSGVFTPVVAKGKEVATSVGNKIETSTSPTVQYAKEIGETTLAALGQAFTGFATAATEVGTSISRNTVHLWQKKYGDDVPKTLFEGGASNGQVAARQTETNLREDINVEQPVPAPATVNPSPETTNVTQPLLNKEQNAYPDLDEKFH